MTVSRPVVTPAERASLLVETLPYMKRWRDEVVVVKYGGNAMTSPDLAVQFAEDIALMHSVGIRPVVVHGGGPQIGDLMARLGKESEFRDGLRVTDAETLDIARMVLVGKVNREIVAELNRHGSIAVGLAGEDAGLIQASAQNPDLGFVGQVEQIRPAIIERLLAEDLVPVVSTIGVDVGGQAYNINADVVAAHIAEALGAEKLVYLTDIEGLRRDVDDPASLVRRATVSQLEEMVGDGTIAGGMIPKIEACVHAVSSGVGAAHILDGRVAHVVLLELFTDSGIGTMIVSDELAALAEERIHP